MCCNKDKSYCCSKDKSKCPVKRYFLPLVGVFALGIFDEVRNFYYFPLIFTFGFFILFWNFPYLVYYTNTQPTYYEDLFVKKKTQIYNVPYQVKEKFELIFKWTIIITSSLTMGFLADYWLYKTTELISLFEILGVTGGILKLFQFINNIIGKILIKIIKYVLKSEVIKYRTSIEKTKESSSKINIELTSIDNHSLNTNFPKSKSYSDSLGKIATEKNQV